MKDIRAQFFMTVALTITLAAVVLLLVTPHGSAGQVHVLEGRCHTISSETGRDGTHLHHASEGTPDDLTRLDGYLRHREVPHLAFSAGGR